MENWNWTEVVWTLVGTAGAFFSFMNIRDGIEDLEEIGRPNGIESRVLHITAYGNIRRDSIRSMIQVAFVSIGILAGLAPSSPNPSPIGLYAGFVFIGATALLSLSAFLDFIDRRTLLRLGSALAVRDKDDADSE